jgi:hypothetical protein
MKNHLKRSQLETVEEIQKLATAVLSRRMASGSAATAGNNAGIHVPVAARGNYCEGDHYSSE